MFIAFILGVCSSTSSGADAACKTTAECAQEAVRIAAQAKRTYESIVPRGAVMAFDLESCPSGWEPFSRAAGRTVIGVGKGQRDQNDKPLTQRSLGDTGGAEQHTLTIPELPKHDHGGVWGGTESVAGMLNSYRTHTQGHKKVEAQGEGKSHNNMPPYVALLYCRKL